MVSERWEAPQEQQHHVSSAACIIFSLKSVLNMLNLGIVKKKPQFFRALTVRMLVRCGKARFNS